MGKVKAAKPKKAAKVVESDSESSESIVTTDDEPVFVKKKKSKSHDGDQEGTKKSVRGKKKKEIVVVSSDSEEEVESEEEAPTKKSSKAKKTPAPSLSPPKAVKKKAGVKESESEALTLSPQTASAGGSIANGPWKNPLKGWHNMPDKKVKIVGAQIQMRVPGKTDCWRKTRHNFIMDNAPFHWQKVSGDFEAIVKISGSFENMYDKAGIKIRLDDENWILSGMESFNNGLYCSTSVTLDHTDWSLSPLPADSEKKGVWFCFKRLGNAFETFFSVDGQTWNQTRQGLFTDEETLYVGVCGACPIGDELKVNFESYRCRTV